MRRHRLIAVLLIILLFSIIGFFLTNSLKASDEDKKIYSFESGSITAIDITSKDARVVLERKEEKWEMTEPARYRINEAMVSSVAKKLENLEALRVIEKKAKNLAGYGLDKPEMTVKFKLKGGKQKTLLVGEETASKYQAYVKDQDRDTIYTITLTDAGVLGGGKASAFRDRNFLSIDKTRINNISKAIDGNSEMKLQEYEAGKWHFIEPYRVDAKNDAVKEILKGLAVLKLKDFIEDKPADLKIYGLENPKFTIEVSDKEGKTQKIHYGLLDENKKEAYISLDNDTGVYSVSTEEFDPNNMKIGDLLSETPLSIGIGSVKTVRIIDKGTEYEFLREDSKPEEDVFTYKGKSVKSDDFIALYVNLMALASDGYDAANSGKEPELSVEYESREGNDRVRLDLSKRDDKSYFLTVDGKPLPFYVTAQKVELVRRWISRAAEG